MQMPNALLNIFKKEPALNGREAWATLCGKVFSHVLESIWPVLGPMYSRSIYAGRKPLARWMCGIVRAGRASKMVAETIKDEDPKVSSEVFGPEIIEDFNSEMTRTEERVEAARVLGELIRQEQVELDTHTGLGLEGQVLRQGLEQGGEFELESQLLNKMEEGMSLEGKGKTNSPLQPLQMQNHSTKSNDDLHSRGIPLLSPGKYLRQAREDLAIMVQHQLPPAKAVRLLLSLYVGAGTFKNPNGRLADVLVRMSKRRQGGQRPLARSKLGDKSESNAGEKEQAFPEDTRLGEQD